jgi:hypothetical protein
VFTARYALSPYIKQIHFVFKGLKKKTEPTKCSNHRTISLISHTAKIVDRIVRKTERKIVYALGEDQFGFRRGKGTWDTIGVLRIATERILDTDEEFCACFLDCQKAFDRLNWTKLMQFLKGTGIDWREKILISKLHTEW